MQNNKAASATYRQYEVEFREPFTNIGRYLTHRRKETGFELQQNLTLYVADCQGKIEVFSTPHRSIQAERPHCLTVLYNFFFEFITK